MRVDVDMTDNSRGAALRARGYAGGQVDYYRDFGIFDRPVYAGKAVSVMRHEYEMLARHDARVAVVPILRFFDGTGLHIHDFLRHGILPGIGTDAPLVSDCQSPFEAMRLAILAQNIAVKKERADGRPPPEKAHWAVAERMLEMATLGGARALFMEDRTGASEGGKAADCVMVALDTAVPTPTAKETPPTGARGWAGGAGALFREDRTGAIEVGKAADCVMVDRAHAATQPTAKDRRLIGALVWAGSTLNVDTVFVAGRKLLEGGRSTLIDEEAAKAEAQTVLAELIDEAGLDGVLPPRRAGAGFRGWTYI